MAKKTNRKPGETISKKEAAMVMKRKDRNLNHSKFQKIVLLLMILAFTIPAMIQVILYIFPDLFA